MAGNYVIQLDLSGLVEGGQRLSRLTQTKSSNAIESIANELLRLSQQEVPLDVGTLQNSGHTQPGDNDQEWIVGYHTVYAARLHEHPEYNFKNGRKGKYLEDPLKNNLNIFKGIYEQIMTEVFR